MFCLFSFVFGYFEARRCVVSKWISKKIYFHSGIFGDT